MWASVVCANLLSQLLVYVFSELLVYSFIQLTVCDVSSQPFTGFKPSCSGLWRVESAQGSLDRVVRACPKG